MAGLEFPTLREWFLSLPRTEGRVATRKETDLARKGPLSPRGVREVPLSEASD